jgi:hypothetical protein
VTSTQPTFKPFHEVQDDLSFNELVALAEFGYNVKVVSEGGVVDDS